MTRLKHAHTNFTRLCPYIGDMRQPGKTYKRYESGGLMPLVMEYLHYNDYKGRPVYSMAHYGEQNGDLMRDPDLVFSVDWEAGTVEPMSFRNDYMGVYQEVYIERDGKHLYSQRLRVDLDEFLYQWMANIEASKYELVCFF